jgi:RpiR family carbohydrate utilization transcriptional regulator
MDQDVRGESKGPASANVLEVIRSMLPSLRKSDRKVAETVLADPDRALNFTVAEAATVAGVSQPTVIRFANAIGCTGYQDFRIRLAQSLALGVAATHSVLLDTDDPETVAKKIFDYTMTSLDWARNHLDHKALAEAVDILAAAKAIEFFGFGASGIVAADAQQKFPLFGVPCSAQADSHQQLMAATMMRAGDAAVAISNTGSTRSVIELARVARESGAKVIGLVGGDSPLVGYCDVAIIVETLDNTNAFTPTTSRIAALVVIDILATSVALRRDDRHKARVATMKRRLRDARNVQLF